MGGYMSQEQASDYGSSYNYKREHSSDMVSSCPEASDNETTLNMTGSHSSASVSNSLRRKLKILLGNTEKLSSTAQKLFAMGKIYLTRQNGDPSETDGFPALFQLLPQNDCEGLKDPDKTVENNECHFPSESCMEVSSQDSTASSTMQSNMQIRFVDSKSSGVQHLQNYCQWKASHDLLNLNYLCFAPQKVIYLQPLDTFPDFCTAFRLPTNNLTLGFLDLLQGFMQIYFSGMEVVILPSVSVHSMAWKVRSRLHEVTKQKQYCVTDLFPYLHGIMPKQGHSILGLVWTDLYPENFNFVLGETSYAHKSAVISFGRFEPIKFDVESHRDITAIDGAVLWKLMRTLSHEMCHVFGFSHCAFFHCAMNESSSVNQALSQPLFLCPVCLRKLQTACGFDVLERYQLLLRFLHNIGNQFSDSVQIKDSILWLESCVDYLSS